MRYGQIKSHRPNPQPVLTTIHKTVLDQSTACQLHTSALLLSCWGSADLMWQILLGFRALNSFFLPTLPIQRNRCCQIGPANHEHLRDITQWMNAYFKLGVFKVCFVFSVLKTEHGASGNPGEGSTTKRHAYPRWVYLVLVACNVWISSVQHFPFTSISCMPFL